MYDVVVASLQSLCRNVCDSEDVLGRLRAEVSLLRARMIKTETPVPQVAVATDSTFKRRPAIRLADRPSPTRTVAAASNVADAHPPTIERRRRFSSLRDHDLNQSEFELDMNEFSPQSSSFERDQSPEIQSVRAAVQHDESPDLINLEDYNESVAASPAKSPRKLPVPANTRNAPSLQAHGFESDFSSLNLNLNENNKAPANAGSAMTSPARRDSDNCTTNNSMASDFVVVKRPETSKAQPQKNDEPFSFAADLMKNEKLKAGKKRNQPTAAVAPAIASPNRTAIKPTESAASPRVTRRTTRSTAADAVQRSPKQDSKAKVSSSKDDAIHID